ncbi:hypothetical protein [Kitasatospora sp. GP82]|uniref:hypothetical protein n=1 Tax=Kitasatospora sp. GP82 TaxID=3035089 RepID=UPI002473C681|nr:hypothetical protein [Kitasatospora sp. GP82]
MTDPDTVVRAALAEQVEALPPRLARLLLTEGGAVRPGCLVPARLSHTARGTS